MTAFATCSRRRICRVREQQNIFAVQFHPEERRSQRASPKFSEARRIGLARIIPSSV
jgi:imidazoleglycerol phosphate synthase glutamine amidotransferase subunit HisH